MAKHGLKKLAGGCMESNLTTGLLVVVIILIIYLVYLNVSQPAVKPTQQPTQPSQPTKMMEHFEDSANADLTPREGEVIVALYSADWCPHCQNYKPTWEQIKSKNSNAMTKDGKKIRFVNVDCSNDADPSSQKYKVEGYPTVVAISNKKHKHVTDRDTIQDIIESVSNM
jgi:thiol-disulfide isomerase/thioredoxin